MDKIKYVCYKCKKEVGEKHFTDKSGKILCKECSKEEEPYRSLTDKRKEGK